MPVVWTEPALARLADHYVAAPPTEREEIVETVESVNRVLGTRPAEQGESRGDRDRVAFFGRLTVFFRSHADPESAEVLHVRWVTPRPRR